MPNFWVLKSNANPHLLKARHPLKNLMTWCFSEQMRCSSTWYNRNHVKLAIVDQQD